MNVKDIKIPPLHHIIARFFARFHVVTFTIIIIGGMAVVTYLLNEIIIASGEEDPTTPTQSTPNFDQTTIERIDNLNRSDSEIKSLQLPSGQRTNPFTE